MIKTTKAKHKSKDILTTRFKLRSSLNLHNGNDILPLYKIKNKSK